MVKRYEHEDKCGSEYNCGFYECSTGDYVEYADYEKLASELRASDNWLHRLLKSCVILLDDGEVTKRAVEKQSRYNQQALKGE